MAGASGGESEWEEVAARWESGRRLLWESTRNVSEWLIERIDPQSGQTLLELASGTGETGFLAARRLVPGGRLISSDRSPAMLDAARRQAAELGLHDIEFSVLDADAIALPDASLDGVLSRFGYILKGEPPRALSEIRRVLKPGGRLAFAVWAQREHNDWMTIPSEAMVELGYLSAPSAEETRLSQRRNPTTIALLLEQAGFGHCEIEAMAVNYHFPDRGELWHFVSDLRGPLSAVIARLDERERAEVRSAIERRVPHDPRGGCALGGVSLNVLAT